MQNIQQLIRIAKESGCNTVEMIESAEAIATPQDRKCWGLTDAQSDVIAVMYSRGDLQAIVSLAIYYYREINAI